MCVCVCDKVVFIQLCHGSSPDVPRRDFSLKRHRCFASLVFSHLPSLSSHHRSCEEEKIRSKVDSPKSERKYFWITFRLTLLRASWVLLLFEEFLERAPEASFVLLPTPLAEGRVVILLCPAPPLCLVPPWLEPGVLVGLNTRYFQLVSL